MAHFRIAHMYPDLMNLYGDRGNLICLQKRLEWYGHSCSITTIGLGDELDYASLDLLFMGGGSDREQGLVYQDLIRKADRLYQQIDSGLPLLCICGAYQLLGLSYIAAGGKVMEGLGFFRLKTEAGNDRLIGNIIIESGVSGEPRTVVGFENHGGRTYLEDGSLQPFGKVVKGFGNNGRDGSEGLWYRNLIGTYLHGPLLPKNPHIADFFIQAMARRRGEEIAPGLDDSIELWAHEQVKNKILRGKK